MTACPQSSLMETSDFAASKSAAVKTVVHSRIRSAGIYQEATEFINKWKNSA